MSEESTKVAEALLYQRQSRARETVGHFMQVFNMVEGRLNSCIEAICELDTLSGAIICANLNFQAKVSILISLVDLYTSLEPKDWRDSARKTFNRLVTINTDWRNVVAHNQFSCIDDAHIDFSRVQAKRGLKIAEFVKSHDEFHEICLEAVELGNEIVLIVNLAKKNRLEIEEHKIALPTISLSSLGSLYGLPPQLGQPPSSQTATQETPPQTRLAPRLKAD
ncbi:MAG: hypothetical protein ACTHNN_09235 [Xanthobacteraceae bacterium]